ncbi:PadR family transcriptional regulator [Nakamurella flava]|uniref:PadR family transcriptional regulator n=2 Tax=Nakamurella flava TaxID=2576308 RepID=A0A4U6Q9Z4_9ACTN|nr:PadR family transcriptional regulator [Nakamurella flava]
MRPDAVRGHLDMLILAVLAAGPLHGYALLNEIRNRSRGELDLAQGTVYPALHRLEGANLLASDWRRVDGRRRRYYHLTSPGREALADERSNWNRLMLAISATIAER